MNGTGNGVRRKGGRKMQGIEQITGQITETARAEAEALLAETERRCRRLTAEYEEQAQEAYRAQIRNGVQEHELRVQRLRKHHAAEAKKRLLTLKQELIDAAFARAIDLLKSMDESEYVTFLAYLASNAAESGTESVQFREQDHFGIGRRVVEQANRIRAQRDECAALTLGEARSDIGCGLILRQGEMETVCDLYKLLSVRRDELAVSAAAVLFD